MAKPYPLSVKLKSIDLYKQGYSCESISKMLDINPKTIYRWVVSRSTTKEPNVRATSEFKEKLVREIIEKSLPYAQVARKCGVSESAVYSWLQIVKLNGYTALFRVKPKGRPPKTMPRGRPKKQEPKTELEKLKVELERTRTENALLKKVIALVEQREAQMREVAKSGHKPSKN